MVTFNYISELGWTHDGSGLKFTNKNNKWEFIPNNVMYNDSHKTNGGIFRYNSTKDTYFCGKIPSNSMFIKIFNLIK